MINQTKTQLFEVFKKFDKDGNGYVDSNELITISKEMNEEITKEEVDKLMKIVDTNGDGKISFEEFWQWWQFGKQEKLERLVFLKLQLMNLLKTVNFEFTRYGISIQQKYESKLDHHYWAINYGDFQPHLRFSQKFRYNGAGVADELMTLNGFPQAKHLQFVIILRAPKPAIAKEKLEKLWTDFKAFIQTEEDPQLGGVIGPIIENALEIEFQERKDSVAIQININHMIIEMTMEEAYIPYCAKLGKDLQVDIDFTFGIKNGLQKMMKKDQIFIKYLLEGFIVELKATFNSDMIKKIFGLVLAMFKERVKELKAKKMQGKKPVDERMVLPLLFRSSKFHLQFKDMEDVDQFLRSMGLEELARDQPTARQLIDDLRQDFELQQMKDEKSQSHFIFQLCQTLADNFIAQGTININIPNAYTTISFNLEGLKEFFDAVFQENEKTEKLKQDVKNVRKIT